MTDQDFKQAILKWQTENPEAILDVSLFSDRELKLLDELAHELAPDIYPIQEKES